jgi:CHAD domain-containing protein/CYTH domain-containing protein
MIVARLAVEARDAFVRMEESDDAGALHDFRVATRRMRSTIRACRPHLRGVVSKSMRRHLREIARASGENRDLEVQLEWLRSQSRLGARQKAAAWWLTEKLMDLQATARKKVDAMLRGVPAILKELTKVSDHAGSDAVSDDQPSFVAVLAEQLAEALHEMARALERVKTIADQDEAHDARIAGKRLRYLLEPIAAEEAQTKKLLVALREFQDTVGSMHDAYIFRLRIELLLARVVAPVTGDSPENARDMLPPPEVYSGLAALAARLRLDERSLYRRMRTRWSRRAQRAFVAQVTSLVATLSAIAAESNDNVEIERKYLLRSLPPKVKRGRLIEIDQGWIPGEKFAERVRRSRVHGSRRASRVRTQYFRTIKLGSGVRRMELEERTTRAIFDAMWPLTAGKRVSKRRYVLRDAGLKWEVDSFNDRKLVLAEVELSNEQIVPRLPRWLKPFVVREVTDDPKYVNRNLAR